MKNKPKLSFLQIWNLSFGFLGVQIGYSLQNSNTSSILQVFGADLSSLSYFWLMAPIAGLIVQPIIGMFSDSTWSKKLGRRRPYILLGALISTIALLLMPNCNKLMAFAPLVMGALIFLFMDLSFNITMQPFRALVTDMLDDSQKTEGFGSDFPDKPRQHHRRAAAAFHDLDRCPTRPRRGLAAHSLFLLRGRGDTVFDGAGHHRSGIPEGVAEYNGASEDGAAAPAEKKSFL